MAKKGKSGFTLVEVALTVAVGLIILGGAVTGYQAVKDNAASAMARRKVNTGASIVIEYSSANYGRVPTSVAGATGGEFSTVWQQKFPEEYNKSPWGGDTADSDGAVEYAPFANADMDPTTAPDNTATITTDQSQAANIVYVSVTGPGYVKLKQLSNPDAQLCKTFVLSIYDRVGQPWFHIATNK